MQYAVRTGGSTLQTLKKQYTHVYGTETGVVAQLACGMTSGTCGMLVSYPLALVRTRLQALGE
jgi:hypothetical protein